MTALAAVVALFLSQTLDAEILRVSVVRESNDEVELQITYRLARVREETLLGAITMFAGSSTGHWSYQTATLEPGTHEATVTVGRNADAPPVYRSDSFKISMWGGARLDYTYPFEKLWCAQASACHDGMLVAARNAPLEERLTSVLPSIRAQAIAEADGLDDEQKRELLPGVVERVHHAELDVRFNALRLLQDWQFKDPMLTVPLVEAMSDPHPGISRVATSVLTRLAEPSDTLAEDALKRAAQSADESTRRYAEEGLARLERDRKLALKPKLEGPTPDNESDCIERGGRWGRFGLYLIPECNVPAPDVGRACTDSVECISACVSELPTGNSGTCYGWTIVRGTCLNYVEDGKVHGTLCVD